MATPIQDAMSKYRTIGPNGELTEETGDEIQNLSKKAGLPAPPVTPLGGQMIGAGPDQTKMLGTVPQKQAAMNLANQAGGQNIANQTIQNQAATNVQPQGQQNLATAQREQQVRSTATAQEQASQNKSQAMQDLGQLGDRVNDFVNAQRQSLETAAGQAGTSGGVQEAVSSTAQAAAGQDPAALKNDLQALEKDPNNQQLMAQINNEMGRDPNTVIQPAEISGLYQSAVDAISQGGANAINNSLTASDLFKMPNFGYTPDQLSGLLGVPANQLAGMTVGQIRDQVQNLTTQEYSKTANLGAQAVSGELGTAERGLAQQAGKEASRVGTRATEADMNNLDTQIKNADQVQFGGQSYNVNDLLSNTGMSKVITDYMNAAPGSASRTQIEQTEPQLVDFINKNQAVLSDAATAMGNTASALTATQQANKQAFTVNGVSLDPNLVKNLVPDSGKVTATNYKSLALPQYLNTLGAQAGAGVINQLNTANSSHPEVVNGLNKLTPDQLSQLNIGGAGKWANAMQALTTTDQLKSVDTSNPDAVINALYGGKVTADQLKQSSATAAADDALGISHGDVPSSDPATLAAQLKKAQSAGPQSIQDILSGNFSNPQQQTTAPITAPTGAAGEVESKLFGKGSSNDPTKPIDAQEIQGGNMSFDDLQWMKQNSAAGKYDSSAKSEIDSEIHDQQVSATTDFIKQSNTGSIADQLKALQSANQTLGQKVDSPTVQARIDLLNKTQSDMTALDAQNKANSDKMQSQKQEDDADKMMVDASELGVVTAPIALLPRAQRDTLRKALGQAGKSMVNMTSDDLNNYVNSVKNSYDPNKDILSNAGSIAAAIGRTQVGNFQSNVQTGINNAVAGAKDAGGSIASAIRGL